MPGPGTPAARTFAALLLALAAVAAAPARQGGESRSAQLLALHVGDAASYAIYRDAARTQKLELRREPIYRWSNPTRNGGQEGDVFLWTDHGRPEAVASIFSHPRSGRSERRLCHELHSLSEAVLVVDRDSPNRWEPKAPGVELRPIPGAPAPAPAAPQRMAQIRALAREFGGRSLSDKDQAWELRLLPQPLYRYEKTRPEILDGALFALVSSAGTDPEVLLVIEARTGPDGPRWVFGAARFSDMSLWLTHKGREVWTALRGPDNTFERDRDERFRFYQDHIVPEFPAPATPNPAEAK